MCGIAGLYSRRLDPADRQQAVAKMLEAMHHRGPDDEGTTDLQALTMGMRRLAIFDPANGHQPMTSPDGRHTLVFNGSIYNHRELRNELEDQGYRFQTHCDTEVLLNAWNAWREKALIRVRGMFAIAIWDHRENALTLARDPLGIKPLYFSQRGDGLIFASELNALIASGKFDREISIEAVDAFLGRLGVPAPMTIYRHGQSLTPGEIVRWCDGQLQRETYWQLPRYKPGRKIDARGFQSELREQIEASIAAHRLADVPVGAFLSGGLDSAITTGLMSQNGNHRLKTFSIGFEESEFSEAEAAAETARHFGTEHAAVVLTGRQAANEIPHFLRALDQPTGDGLNTFVVSRAAREGGVTAVLSGLGGDELFGGYHFFQQTPRLSSWLPMWKWVPPFLKKIVCQQLDTRGAGPRKVAGILRHARDLHDVADRQRQVLSDEARAELLGRDPGFAAHPAQNQIRAAMIGAPAELAVSAWELRGYMADVLLRDSDVFSMSASLELRVPFVDRPLIEWLWQQPAHLRFQTANPKQVLYESMADMLPPGLRERPKRGFTLPFPRWMRKELRPFLDETLSIESVNRSGILNGESAQNQWRKFLSSQDDKAWSRVWSLAVLVAFLNRSQTA